MNRRSNRVNIQGTYICPTGSSSLKKRRKKKQNKSQSGDKEYTGKAESPERAQVMCLKALCFRFGTVTIKTGRPASVGLEGAFPNQPRSQTLPSLTREDCRLNLEGRLSLMGFLLLSD